MQAKQPLAIKRGFITTANGTSEPRAMPLLSAMALCGAAVAAGATGISAWDAAHAEEAPKPTEKVGRSVFYWRRWYG